MIARPLGRLALCGLPPDGLGAPPRHGTSRWSSRPHPRRSESTPELYQASWYFESPRINFQWNAVVHGAEKRFCAHPGALPRQLQRRRGGVSRYTRGLKCSEAGSASISTRQKRNWVRSYSEALGSALHKKWRLQPPRNGKGLSSAFST